MNRKLLAQVLEAGKFKIEELDLVRTFSWQKGKERARENKRWSEED
jgi:hypothetical protein